MGDRKLNNNVWNCPNCGLEEYQSQSSPTEGDSKDSDTSHYTNSNKQQEDLSKHHLNKEKTVSLKLSEGKEDISRAFSLDNAEIIGIFSYAGGNKLIMKISKDCKLCCEFRLDNISFEVDFSNEIEEVINCLKERDYVGYLSELMIKRFIKETNKQIIEFVEFTSDSNAIKLSLLWYAEEGLVSFGNLIKEVDILDTHTGINKQTKYMTKEKIEKHNKDIDEQLKSMKDFIDDLF